MSDTTKNPGGDNGLNSPLLTSLMQQMNAMAPQGSTNEDGSSNYNADYASQLSQQIAAEQGRLQNAATMKANGQNADGSYIRPEWEDLIDPATGLLKDQYVVGKDFQPIQNNTDALQKFHDYALRDPGTNSQWANLQLQKQGQDELTAQNNAASGANAKSQGMMDSLAAQGGISGGARERMGRTSLRDSMRSSQDIANQGITNRLGIQTTDESNRISGLKDLQTMETDQSNYDRQNQEAQIKLQQANIGNALAEKQAHRNDDMAAWSKNQDVWASGKQADAQAKSGGGGGCCFIFLEARYGNGTMDSVVRRFRDEHMTLQNKRGYYKLSEVLVPAMRKSRVVKLLVRITMTDPMVAYGKAHYGESKIGFIFKPVVKFWLNTFNYLGRNHEFIRENGETV